MRPPNTSRRPHLPVREVGKGDDGALADTQHLLQHLARLARGPQRLAQDHVVEGIVGIVAQVGIGIALDHHKPLATQAFTPAWLSSMPRASTRLVFMR